MVNKSFVALLGVVFFGAMLWGAASVASAPSKAVTSSDLSKKKKTAEAALEKALKSWTAADAEVKKSTGAKKKQAEAKNLAEYQNYKQIEAEIAEIEKEEKNLKEQQSKEKNAQQKQNLLESQKARKEEQLVKRMAYLERIEEARLREMAKQPAAPSIWTTIE